MNPVKPDPENKANDKCECSSNTGLFVKNRQLSLICASGILTLFITFMTGYFIGQHNAVEAFSDQAEQESFADQVYASLFMSNEQESSKESSEENDNIVSVKDESDEKLMHDQEKMQEHAEPQQQYYAQLIGFGTERAAQKFIQKLNNQGITVNLKKRRSKTAKGKMVSWYQVVTDCYTDKEKLRVLVDRIEKTEKIKGAQIISC